MSKALKIRYGEIEEHIDDVESYFVTAKSFDVLDSPPSDHRYLSSIATCTSLAQLCKSSQTRWVGEEWKAFKALNPSHVYVRVYEASMEVSRIALVAQEELSSSTFHHCLFFFDVRFPRGFPSKPPQVFYHSFGESQANTWHQNGTVSVELFNQWDKLNLGSSSNKENKESNCNGNKKSAVLELLGILRKLAVTSTRDPNNNKGFFMKSCLRMLRCPPKGFEVFVAGYFRTRAHRILLNFRSAVDICGVSEMRILFFRLVRAFEKNGSYCKHHYNQQQYDRALLEERNYVNPIINDH